MSHRAFALFVCLACITCVAQAQSISFYWFSGSDMNTLGGPSGVAAGLPYGTLTLQAGVPGSISGAFFSGLNTSQPPGSYPFTLSIPINVRLCSPGYPCPGTFDTPYSAAISVPGTYKVAAGASCKQGSVNDPFDIRCTGLQVTVSAGSTQTISLGTLGQLQITPQAAGPFTPYGARVVPAFQAPLQVVYMPVPVTSLVTGFGSTIVRNNYSGLLGYSFTVGPAPMTVTSLGRIVLTGSTGSHLVKLICASNGKDVPGGSVTVPAGAGTPGQFMYASLMTPVTLTPNTSYFLVSQETSGGDSWYDVGGIATTKAATSTGPVYWNGSSWVRLYFPGFGYVPPTLQYTLTPGLAPGSFITSFTTTPFRDDVTGWEGMSFTVGAKPLIVSSLGRAHPTSGGWGPHVLKLVNAGTGIDVPGGAATVSFVGPDADIPYFEYADLPNSVVLQANTTYYLVSQETSGAGNIWYGSAPVQPTTDATVNGPVVNNGSGYTSSGAPNIANGPLDFKYKLAVTGDTTPPTVAVTTPVNGAVVNPGDPVMATVSDNVGVVAVQFKSNGLNLGAEVVTPPYSVPITGTGTKVLTAVVRDASGNTATSVPVTVNVFDPNSGMTSLFSKWTLGVPRNDYTGWIGMQFGGVSATDIAMGRMCAPGNQQIHVLKVVRVSDGVVMASDNVDMAGCTPGQFVSIDHGTQPLTADTAYLLVSQETAGGDTWYDFAPVVPNAGAIISGITYWNGASYFTISLPNYTYGPLLLAYR